MAHIYDLKMQKRPIFCYEKLKLRYLLLPIQTYIHVCLFFGNQSLFGSRPTEAICACNPNIQTHKKYKYDLIQLTYGAENRVKTGFANSSLTRVQLESYPSNCVKKKIL